MIKKILSKFEIIGTFSKNFSLKFKLDPGRDNKVTQKAVEPFIEKIKMKIKKLGVGRRTGFGL